MGEPAAGVSRRPGLARCAGEEYLKTSAMHTRGMIPLMHTHMPGDLLAVLATKPTAGGGQRTRSQHGLIFRPVKV